MFIPKFIVRNRVWSIVDEAAQGGAGGTAPAEAPAVVPPAETAIPAPETPIPAPAAPETPAPAAIEEPTKPMSIADYNKAREAEIDADGPEADAPAEESASEEKPAAEVPAVEPITFEEADTVEIVLEKGKKLKEQYDFDPSVQAYIDNLESRVQGVTPAYADLPASPETVKEIVMAFDALFDMVPVAEGSSELVPNTAPAINLLRTNYGNEFRSIAEGILASDSTKYAGSSLMEEILVDNFGRDKAQNMLAYGHANIPLPVIPAGVNLPAGMAEGLKEAYMQLPEPERFEIEGLANDVRDLEDRLKDASEYARPDLEQELTEKRNRLNGKIFTIEKIQSGLNADRDTKARTERQNKEQAAAFLDKVNTAYNTEIFGMADTFSKDLAPRLTFADAAVQPALARDINTRVFNALAFTINDDGSYSPDPMADYYAGQLAQEGVKFDFAKGRELLKQHHNATARVIALQNTPNTSPQAIERAVKKKEGLMNEIRANQVDLMGQISTKYVKGVGNALGAQTQALLEKKQAARPRVVGNAAGNGGAAPKPVSQTIAEFNRARAKEIKDGDDLYENYVG